MQKQFKNNGGKRPRNDLFIVESPAFVPKAALSRFLWERGQALNQQQK